MYSNRFNPNDLPLVLSVSELAKVLGIGRNAAYTLVNTGQIRCVHIGKNMTTIRTAKYERKDRTSAGHKIEIIYQAKVSV